MWDAIRPWLYLLWSLAMFAQIVPQKWRGREAAIQLHDTPFRFLLFASVGTMLFIDSGHQLWLRFNS